MSRGQACLWAAAFALTACADPSVAMDSRNQGQASLWESVSRGQAEQWRDREVTLSGYAVARALGSVALLRRPPKKDEDGNPDYDAERCIGLMVTPEQYRSLQRNERVKISGKFSAVDIRRQDAVVTHIEVEGRRIYPRCISAHGIASYIFVERVEF